MDAAFERALERIHPRLREHQDLRYTVILNGRKKPEGRKWTTEANYAYGDPVLAGYLAEGHNYGICTGIADLIVLDGDDVQRLEDLGVTTELPNTLISRTGRDGLHYYLFCPDLEDRIVLEDPELVDEDGDPLHLGEIQALGQQVVGPGSIHPNGNKYEVVNDVPIATITKDELLKILSPLKLKIDAQEKSGRQTRSTGRGHGGSAADLINIDLVAWPKDIKERAGAEVRGTHPLHGSDSGKNFSVNTAKNCWYCFRHKTGGGPLEWLAVESGLICCNDAKPGCLKSVFKQVLDIARDKGFDIPESKPRSKSKSTPTGCENEHIPHELPKLPTRAEMETALARGEILAYGGHFEGDPEAAGPTVIDAIKALHGVCDGATSIDGAGFDRYVLQKYGDIIQKAVSEGSLSQKEEDKAYRFLKRYKKQLKGLGIEYGQIGLINATGGGSDGDKAFDQMCALVPKWIDEYHFKTMADDETIYRHLDGVYVNDGANFIKQLVELELGDKCNNHLKNEAVGKVQRQTYVKRDDFNRTGVLNLKNGLLNLETGEFRDHTPDLLSTIQLPVEYDPNAVCPAIDKFRGEVLDPNDKDLVEEILGWLLWPAYSVHKAVMMVGSGRNGKGTLLRLMVAMLGKANVSDVSLQQLCDNRFMPARLYGKTANLGGDLPAIDISDTAAFKGLTGGDRMTVENKFGQPFEFDNRAKLVFSTNRIPKTPDDSYAFYSRWILIVFSHVFDVQKGTGDEGLDKKLQMPEELSGMLNAALRGLKRLQSNDWKFSYSKTVEDVELLYKRLSEPVLAFLLDECMAEFDESVEKTVFYNAFKRYSDKHGLKPMSQSKFWRALKDQSEIPVSDYRPDGNQPRCVRGVRLKPPIPINLSEPHPGNP
ncbi:MAG: phage/plasmid primase, P4 family [Methanotrichaceae archaeon]|jgi:putative DNA primase/helicase